MTVYEMLTYTLHVGKMAEAVELYTEFGYPALQKGGQDKKSAISMPTRARSTNSSICGSSTTMPTVALTGLRLFANKNFVEGFAVQFRPLLASQEVKLLTAAPWGPDP